MITKKLNEIEDAAVDVMAVFAPWLSPIPSAYLVGKATLEHLGWHWMIAIVAAFAVESIGVVSVVLALRLHEWNTNKNKTDFKAPFVLSVAVVSVYFIVTIGLTVVLDVYPQLARLAPAIWPILAAVGAVNIAIKNGQQRREESKVQRSKIRQRQPPRQPGATRPPVALPEVRNLAGTKLLIYKAYQSNPHATQTEIASQLGISRQAVGKHLKRMNGVLKR